MSPTARNGQASQTSWLGEFADPAQLTPPALPCLAFLCFLFIILFLRLGPPSAFGKVVSAGVRRGEPSSPASDTTCSPSSGRAPANKLAVAPPTHWRRATSRVRSKQVPHRHRLSPTGSPTHAGAVGAVVLALPLEAGA